MAAKAEKVIVPMTTNFVDAEYAVFGLGKTGLSCARFLARRGFDFAVIDTRDDPPQLANLKESLADVVVITGATSPRVIGRCQHVVLSPGISRDHPIVTAAIERGIEVIGDIELFARHARAPVVAVTGSNGKSTVVTMVSEILSAAGLDVRSGGNLGTPALDLLYRGDPDCYVLEVSSFQLESTGSLAPKVACILNVSPDHMDRYIDMSSYLATKTRIYEHAEVVVLNMDDGMLKQLRPNCETRRISSGLCETTRYRLDQHDGDLWLVAAGEEFMRADDLILLGKHNCMNALAAVAITDKLSVPREVQKRVLRAFRGLSHRCQTIATKSGIDWIDDSKGTNVGATCAAIRSVFSGRPGVLIAGGQGKGADFNALAAAVEGRVHDVILIGQDARVIAASLDGRVDVHFALDMHSAVAAARLLARRGEAVLLSPACASFDMFDNFEARGRAFIDAVEEISSP